MLDIILRILGILGIVILILLGVLVLLLAILLFYPITYKVTAQKSAEELTARVKVNWLFGLLRARFSYPEPGNFVVKLLWINLYDSADSAVSEKEMRKNAEGVTADSEHHAEETVETIKNEATEDKITETTKSAAATDYTTDSVADTTEDSSSKGILSFLTAKYEKIKYTILKIYDKIKHIWENFSYYRDLFREELTQELCKHGFYRLKKIFQNIRPRRLNADIVFGTGSPDTTGYAMAVYGMLSPMLGQHVNVTPDFTQGILLGEFYAAGHITLFQVVFHSLMVVFDKRLKLLMSRIKKHRNQQS